MYWCIVYNNASSFNSRLILLKTKARLFTTVGRTKQHTKRANPHLCMPISLVPHIAKEPHPGVFITCSLICMNEHRQRGVHRFSRHLLFKIRAAVLALSVAIFPGRIIMANKLHGVIQSVYAKHWTLSYVRTKCSVSRRIVNRGTGGPCTIFWL